MKAIDYVVEFTVKPGKRADFEKMANWFVERCQADEPGTKTYQWYLSDDGTKCLLHEGFDDSAGLVAHAAGPNVQGHIGDLLETADITRFEAYGDPDEEAQAVLDAFGAQVFHHYAGFTR